MSDSELPPMAVLMTHLMILRCAVRAMHAKHPAPEAVEQQFRSLVAQMQAHPGVLMQQGESELVRRLADDLFAPPSQPHTEL